MKEGKPSVYPLPSKPPRILNLSTGLALMALELEQPPEVTPSTDQSGLVLTGTKELPFLSLLTSSTTILKQSEYI